MRKATPIGRVKEPGPDAHMVQVFEGEQSESKTLEVGPRASVLRRFDAADKSGILGGRAVRRMWLVDVATLHVIRRHGVVAAEIEARYREFLARTTATN
jgi:hypothetical protein